MTTRLEARPLKSPSDCYYGAMGSGTVLIIGNSDGIGLSLTRRLLDAGHRVLGASRSPSPIEHGNYRHVVADVTSENYIEGLEELLANERNLFAVYYCAGIGAKTNPQDLSMDYHVFDVNLMGAMRTAQFLIPKLLEQGGRFIVLSSLADRIINHEASSYTASKAAVSAYFEGLGLKLRHTKLKLVNVRFGFVDTKMARAGVKPFMITTERAAERLEGLLEGPVPLRMTYPKRMAVVVAGVAWFQNLRVLWG
jgi:NAD(P)-dependent dehydrogenase (short-subunit alcohol dehydrogenase family)